MSDGLFGRYEHLVKRPHEDRAKELLLKTASLVKPIMRKHGWKVGTLAEFVPSNANLLGMNYNRGAKILLRLRPNHAPDTFLELESVVGTMLHELTHNVHGPHDAKFYALLGELEEEYDALRRKGFSGEGFMSDGARLGGSHGVPAHIGRIKGLEAAERRAQKQRLMGPGGKLGGGSAARSGKSARELAAEAAERRLRDDKRCEHGDSAAIELEAAEAAKESEGQDASEVIVIDDGSDEAVGAAPSVDGSRAQAQSRAASPATIDKPAKKLKTETSSASNNGTDEGWRCPSCTVINEAAAGECFVCEARRPGVRPARKPPVDNPDGTWNCQTCTFINPHDRLGCEVCDAQRPRDESKGWYCDFCYQFGNEHAYWMCRSCGAIKRRG